MKHLAILGSTGSIGTSALAVAARHPDRFKVDVLAAGTRITDLARQVRQFAPHTAVVLTEKDARQLKIILGPSSTVTVLWGASGYCRAAACPGVDIVLLAMVGAAGLMPAMSAIDAGKQVALANKETLVMAGKLVMDRVREKGVTLYPVDSEHSAIFQCLAGNRRRDLSRVFLTASGGPFRKRPGHTFDRISAEDALSHPTWTMGSKITIDSATLMNKALEIIEAVHLFDLTPQQVEVVVHPQSIVHSMVGFTDGTVMAQMGEPDMKGAIALALSWPERLDLGMAFPDFFKLSTLHFEPPDRSRFPSLDFAVTALETGGTLPAVMNAANEVAVAAFLEGRIGFTHIFSMIRAAMDCHAVVKNPDLEEIIQADTWARQWCERWAPSG